MTATHLLIFGITFVSFCAGAYTLLALLRWLADDRPRWIGEDSCWRGWYRLTGWCRLSAFWGGVLSVAALTAVVLYTFRPHGAWTALALSAVAGWSNPDDLGRYVAGMMAGVAAVLILVGAAIGLPVFGGLLTTLIIIAVLAAAGATVFMAGAIVRRMAG